MKNKKLQAWHREKQCWSCRYVWLAEKYIKVPTTWLSVHAVERIKYVAW